MEDTITQVPNAAIAGWMMLIWIPLLVWSLIWKGIALWKAARLSSKGWFVVLLLVNTIGILEIIYIFAVAKKKENPTLAKPPQV